MNHLKKLSGLLLVAALAVPAISMAQDHDDRHEPNQAAENHDDHGHEGGPEHAPAPAHAPGPAHGWHKGDRLPANYRSNQYVVNDWQSRHLRQPPSGYHWVNVNGDYVLAAVATGVIADLLLSQ